MDDLIHLMATEAEARRERGKSAQVGEGRNGTAVSGGAQSLGDIMAILRPRDKARDTPRLQRMIEGEDVESFLITYERVL